MLNNTKTIITAALRSDATITPEITQALIAIIDGKIAVEKNSREAIDRILSRQQVADMFGVSVKAVDYYGRKGIIRRISITGKKAQGYSEASIRAAMCSK